MKGLRFALALAAAIVVHALGSRLVAGFPAAVDLFLVLAVFNSLSSSAAWSAVGGSAAGLVRDALSGGLYGLHGFADTLTAYFAARLQQRLVVVKAAQVGMLMMVAAAIQLVVLTGLQWLLLSGGEWPGWKTSVVRLLSAGILGSLFFVLFGSTREMLARLRERRRRRLKIAI